MLSTFMSEYQKEFKRVMGKDVRFVEDGDGIAIFQENTYLNSVKLDYFEKLVSIMKGLPSLA